MDSVKDKSSYKPNIDPEKIKLNPASEMNIKIDYLGEKKYPIIIVDNFYKDPDYIRELALEQDFQIDRIESKEWMKSTHIKLKDSEFSHFLHQNYSNRFGFTQKPEQLYLDPNGWHFSRIDSQSNEDLVDYIHVDPHMLQGITFLNPPDQCRGGTSFFKHKYFEIEEFIQPEEVFEFFIAQCKKEEDHLPFSLKIDPKTIQNIIQMGTLKPTLKLLETNEFNIQALHRLITGLFPQKRDILMDSWVETMHIKMKYNRFICFPAFIVHGSKYNHEWFGKSNKTRKLTQNYEFGWAVE